MSWPGGGSVVGGAGWASGPGLPGFDAPAGWAVFGRRFRNPRRTRAGLSPPGWWAVPRGLLRGILSLMAVRAETDHEENYPCVVSDHVAAAPTAAYLERVLEVQLATER